MKETGALLAGEMSGHIFFKERWFGFDDGLYGAARLLEVLSRQSLDADAFFARYPQDIGTPEINVTVTDETKFDLVARLAREATSVTTASRPPWTAFASTTRTAGDCAVLQHHPGAGAALRGQERGSTGTHTRPFRRRLKQVDPTLEITL